MVGKCGPAPPPRDNELLESITANCTLLQRLWECFVVDALCHELRAALPNYVHASDSAEARPTHYVGVHQLYNGARGYWAPFLRSFAASRLARSRGAACKADSDCQTAEMCVESACVLASVYYHDALSPGIAFNYTTGVYELRDEGDVWMESNWNSDIGISLFQQSSSGGAWAMLVMGVLLTVGSTAALLFAKRRVTKHYKLV